MSDLTNSQHVDAVAAWARATCPDLASDYEHAPSTKLKALPDVVVELVNEGIVRDDARFPFAQLQQAWLRAYNLGLSFMVEVDVGDDDSEATATAQLRTFAEQLTRSLLSDPTLGGRVMLASPLVNFDYTPPFVQYEDGTQGREMTMQLAVADLMED